MCKVVVSGKGTEVTDALRAHVEARVLEAVSVFDVEPMRAEVVLRFGHGRPPAERNTCDIVVSMPRKGVRVSESGADMYVAIDAAAEKLSRKLRRHKTRVVKRPRLVSARDARAQRESLRTMEDVAFA